MVLDAGDHDTWSCGSFFTNPVLAAGDFAALESRVASRLGADAAAPPRFPAAEGGVKTSAAWLIEQAGFAKGFGLPGPAVAVDQAHPGRDEPGCRDGIRRGRPGPRGA